MLPPDRYRLNISVSIPSRHVRGPGEGETVLIPDGRQFLFRAVSTDTDGAYSLAEFVLPPAPPGETAEKGHY